MKNQKGFIQIPLIIIIIASLAVVSVGTGFVLNKKEKTEPIIENTESLKQEENTEKTSEIKDEKEQPKEEGNTQINKEAELKKQAKLAEQQRIEKEKAKKIAEEEKPISEAAKIITDFLISPTLDNFKVFCEKAKNIPSKETKDILSNDKTQILKEFVMLSEIVIHCNLINNKNYTFVVPKPDDFVLSLDGSDSDNLRMSKIGFNERLRDVNAKYPFYIVDNYIFKQNDIKYCQNNEEYARIEYKFPINPYSTFGEGILEIAERHYRAEIDKTILSNFKEKYSNKQIRPILYEWQTPCSSFNK